MTTEMVSSRLVTSAIDDNDTQTSTGTSSVGGDLTGLNYLIWLMPIIFGILIMVGVVGNTLVIYVIIKASKRTVTNYYIMNLATADILFLSICAPPTAAQYTASGFYFGRFMCKTVFYLQMVTAQATCFHLMAMSVDRFQAIVRPLKSLRTRTLQTAVFTSVLIWLFALVIYTPILVYFDIKYIDYHGLKPYCEEQWPSQTWSQGFVVVSFVLVFSLPMVAIAICYSTMIRHLWQRVVPNEPLSGSADAVNAKRHLRQKRKITWMVLAVVVIFAACWFPIHIINLWRRLDPDFPLTKATYNFRAVGHVMSYISSCANPFVYAFLGENFRRSFRRAFPCCFQRAQERQRNCRGVTSASNAGTVAAGTGSSSSKATPTNSNTTEMTNLNSRTSAK